jgi:hypothetical protein
MTATEITRLEDLRGFRGAPPLTPAQRVRLQAELRQRVSACDWCTIGVMAPASGVARSALRSFERALGWPPLADASAAEDPQGPVFLKGHQRNGTVRLREEAGLAEGVLISGHSAADPGAEDTWGPLPLDLFASDPGQGGGDGATGL